MPVLHRRQAYVNGFWGPKTTAIIATSVVGGIAFVCLFGLALARVYRYAHRNDPPPPAPQRPPEEHTSGSHPIELHMLRRAESNLGVTRDPDASEQDNELPAYSRRDGPPPYKVDENDAATSLPSSDPLPTPSSASLDSADTDPLPDRSSSERTRIPPMTSVLFHGDNPPSQGETGSDAPSGAPTPP